MAEKWFDNVPDDAFPDKTDKLYMEALATIRAGLSEGLDFDRASATVAIADEALKRTVLDDVLKVIIAEEHFAKKTPLDQLGRNLNLSVERLEKARTEMLEDVEKSAVAEYYDNIKKGTEH
jgi:hypothetical protein